MPEGRSQYQKIIQLAQADFQTCASLPFAVFVLSVDGVFLKYNDSGRELFDLPEEVTFQDSISHYYLHPVDREENLRRLRQLDRGQWLRDTTLDLCVTEQVKFVRDYTKAIWEGEEIVGLVSMMVNITKGDRYNRLFKELEVGIFSFRKDAGLVNANPMFLEMHGYKNFEEVRHQPPERFMRDQSEWLDLYIHLKDEGKVLNRYQEQVRKDGTYFTASLSARALTGADGQYLGFEGMMEDVSTEAMYLRLVNDVPVGLFKARINVKNELILLHCNEQYALHRGVADPDDLINTDMRRFFPSPSHFERFFQQIQEWDRQGKSPIDCIEKITDGGEQLRDCEMHIKLLKDQKGKITGLVGAERDVTDQKETKQQLEELTVDIGKVLHSYSSTLISAKSTMDAVTRSFISIDEKSNQRGKIEESKVLHKLEHAVRAADGNLRSMLEKSEEQGTFDDSSRARLIRMAELITAPFENELEMHKLALVRDSAIAIREIIESLEKGHFNKEQKKQLLRDSDEILRLCSLLTLDQGSEAILEMESLVNNLRSYLLSRVKQKEQPKRLDLYEITKGVVRNLGEFAAKRKVDLKINISGISKVTVPGYREDLTRALSNIIHNAIKYSWSRKGPSRPFVKIEGREEAHWVYLVIENWGVPITKEELEKGLLFKVGYRGANSRDRHRPGTGLGLYDALKVVRKHNGKLEITSNPTLGNREDDYSSPFVTQVKIALPLTNQKS